MDKRERILIVEDDERLAHPIRDYLKQHQFSIEIEYRGDSAVKHILSDPPDLIVLDLMLPGLDGFDVCRQIRPNYEKPILMLTARDEDVDQVAGLELGADDYVAKPIKPRVLLARIRALLRRFHNSQQEASTSEQIYDHEELIFGNLQISNTCRKVVLDNQEIELSTNDFDLLWLLAKHAGEVLDRDIILNELRGIGYDGMDRSVDMRISRLRKKLKDSSTRPFRIKTVWGQGYLFVKDAW